MRPAFAALLAGAAMVNAVVALRALRTNDIKLARGCILATAVLFTASVIIHP